MANSDLPLRFLTSTRQASRIFNPDGPHPIRQKHAFVVQFLRDVNADPEWRNGLSFVVKSIERPQVQPIVEEINQYNKKRVIHTGVKYSPVNVTFYDTADGAAMNMWLQYARYYFGDYSQNKEGFSDDILNSTMNDSSADKTGWGFNIRPASSTNIDGINSQFFFNKVVVYQVWGNEYTSYELVNPKITSFNPDDLAYDASEASTIAMTLSYEAIIHGNSGNPQDIFTEVALTNLFENDLFDGQTIEVLSEESRSEFVSGPDQNNFAGSELFNIGTDLGPASTDFNNNQFTNFNRDNTVSDGGVLSRFGSFDFGSVERGNVDSFRGVSQAIGGSSSLARLLGSNFNAKKNLSRENDGIAAAAGSRALTIPGMTKALNTVAAAFGNSALDHTDRQDGLQLKNTAVASLNAQQQGTIQFGNKSFDA